MNEVSSSLTVWDVLVQMGGSATLLAFVASGLMLLALTGLKYTARSQDTRAVDKALRKTALEGAPLLTPASLKLFRGLAAWEAKQTKGLRVFAQVPLGTLALLPAGKRGSRKAAPKRQRLDLLRLDFAITDDQGQVVLAIDLAQTRDEGSDEALKRAVLDKLGIPLLQAGPGTGAVELVGQVDALLGTGLLAKPAHNPVAAAA